MQPYIVSFEINMIFQENSMVKHAQHAGSNTTSETDVPPKAMEWDGNGKEISVTMLIAPSVLIINPKIIDFTYDRYFLVV